MIPIQLDKDDFISFLNSTNINVLKRHKSFLDGIEKKILLLQPSK